MQNKRVLTVLSVHFALVLIYTTSVGKPKANLIKPLSVLTVHHLRKGFPVGGPDLTQVGEGDCRTIWQDVLADVDSPTFIPSGAGWRNAIQAVDWSSNAGQIGSLGETSDIFCHYVYTRAFNNGAFSGLAG